VQRPETQSAQSRLAPNNEIVDSLRSQLISQTFLIIGEAVGSLAHLDSEISARISDARMIVGFRNRLAHDYAAVDDRTVWAIAVHDAPVLRGECEALIKQRDTRGEAD
jgi:uncharacterized protein with HEPN domain